MLNTPYPYMQASNNLVVDMLQTFVDAYTSVAIWLGAMLLVLLIGLCMSELWQSKTPHRAGRKPRPNQPQARSHERQRRGRALLEESSI